jgi:hypothetical protein
VLLRFRSTLALRKKRKTLFLEKVCWEIACRFVSARALFLALEQWHRCELLHTKVELFILRASASTPIAIICLRQLGKFVLRELSGNWKHFTHCQCEQCKQTFSRNSQEWRRVANTIHY